MEMKKILIIFLTIITFQSVYSQSENIHKVYYHDTTYMSIDNNDTNTWFVNRKKLLQMKINGLFVVYYDKSLTDTAIVVPLLKGEYNGVYKEWNRDKGYIRSMIYFEKGQKKGIDETYIYFFPEENDNSNYIHKDSILIEIYDYSNDFTVKYKTINRKEYENSIGSHRKKN
jgi:hypothetical protein